MTTINQLCKNNQRQKKFFKSKTPGLEKNPQQKGICIKIFTRTPKKPNSAIRKVARLKLSNKRKVEAYIPGEGHTLQQYSVALMRGGRVPDLPGARRGGHRSRPVKNRQIHCSWTHARGPGRRVLRADGGVAEARASHDPQGRLTGTVDY